MELQFLVAFFLFLVTLKSLLFFLATTFSPKPRHKPPPSAAIFPDVYPLIGSVLSISANYHRRVQWIADILHHSPSATYTLHGCFGSRQVFTANPTVVRHILKTHFPIYPKGSTMRRALGDFLGNGIFNADGHTWKFQRQVSSHEFNTNSLRKFVETVVDCELSDRLIPILTSAAEKKFVSLDFQDILQRFGFDSICKIAFGFDPGYLLPSLPKSKFAIAFDDGTRISSDRLNAAVHIFWKIKKILDIGSEKRLRIAISEVRELARKITRQKKQELQENATLDSVDLLSRFLSSGHSDEDFVTDIVVSFILAGRDTTSAALTWFFWLLSKHPNVENEILNEIREKSEATVYDEVKDMVYTHAALCESMRLYPPVAVDTKEAMNDDVLPEGTFVKRGTIVAYHVYAMGRSEKLWGSDWAEFRPERWLKRVEAGKWSFVGTDAFTYPVFQAGPRICMGRDMAFLQMKRIVAEVLRRFRVVPSAEEGVEPEYIAHLTSLMKGGFPVRIEKRIETDSSFSVLAATE